MAKYDPRITFMAEEKTLPVIVKYSGNLQEQAANIGTVEILSPDYAIVTLEREKIEELSRLPSVEYIESSKELFFNDSEIINKACIYRDMSYITGDLSGKGVICAVIDSGINYGSLFKDEEGNSRIKYVWDMTLNGNPPQGFTMGRELREDEVSLSSDHIGHGTAVAEIMAGNNGIAYKSDIISVKLNNRNGFVRSTEIMRGIKYISDISLRTNMPAVINLSYGTNDGSHDGTSLFETYIDSMAERGRLSVIVASGNEGDAAHHFKTTVKDGEKTAALFNIAQNTNSVYLSLWKNFSDRISIRLVAPDGRATDNLEERKGIYTTNTGNSQINILFGEPTPYSTNSEIYISIKGDILSGIWLLEITGISTVQGDINIWLPVREGLSPETKFLEPSTDTTLTLPSTALKVITVAGYNSQVNGTLSFSGRGYGRLYNKIKPDIAAPAYEIPVSSGTVTGTSFAAPFVSGSAALLMEWGIVRGNDPYLYGERLKAYLQLGAIRENNTNYPNREWGYGRLCLENTMKALENPVFTMQAETDNEYKVYSDDYIDIVLEDMEIVRDLLEEPGDTLVQIIDDQFAIIHISFKEAYNRFGVTPDRTLSFEPYLMGLMEQSPLDAAGITDVQQQPFLNLRGRGTLVAIIDTGIDCTDPCFIYEDNTTRIVSLWDQSIPGNPPEGQYYGTEFTREQINSYLKEGTTPPTLDTVGHGTRLAAIAAGSEGAAPESEIIVVKLKQAKNYLRQVQIIPEDANVYQTSDLMTAVNYVFKKSRELNKPVSICIGMGTNQSSHTGTSISEEYLSRVAVRVGVAISVCTGNEALAQHHVKAEITNENTYTEVEISVGEKDSGFPVWIWNYVADSVAIEIVSPLGASINRIQPQSGFSNEYRLPLEGTSVYVSYQQPITFSQDQLTVVRFTAPVSGIWKIRLYGDSLLIRSVHLWLPVTGLVNSNTFFLDPDVETTFTAPSGSFNVIATGGWNTATDSIYPRSGRGPTRYNGLKPNVVAPCVLSDFSGTSVSAAVVAGAAALMLQWGIVEENVINMNTTIILSYLIRGTVKGRNDIYPNNVSGYGLIDLLESFDRLI